VAKLSWPIVLALALLLLISAAFIAVFALASSKPSTTSPPAGHYAEELESLLAGADAARGAQLIVEYDCAACHIQAADFGVAPAFAGVADRAATRRPPLTAAEYIYESITNPTAYVVENYPGSMPQNYANRLSPNLLGDIIAYLLTQTTDVS
jgi:mono/diheme cytochrome c family protein